ncbi:MAG: dihydroxyacetone kinase subunit L [Methylococcaceae bacterium]|nr:dihydroxyacetone kinase subunit L [Methylococcaceae bacterium]
MQFTSEILPDLIMAVAETIEQNAEEVTVLDQAIGDGDHVTNLQRGLNALIPLNAELAQLEWAQALQKIGMTLLSTMGGASGSLFGTLFISMSKAVNDRVEINSNDVSEILIQGVEAVKKRGKSDAGEKTMLDVLIPVSESMKQGVEAAITLPDLLENICQTAVEGMESTRNMLATKGRASYLEEKSIGHIDAGARTSQLMICAIVGVFKDQAKD